MIQPDLLASIRQRFQEAKLISPVDITALFVALLTSYFSNSENIQHETLKNRTYDPDYDKTKIIIDAAGRWAPENAGTRPAILIARGEWRTIQEGAEGGRILGSVPATYVRKYLGQHRLQCISKSPAETDLLVDEVFRFLIHIEPIILQELPFITFAVQGIGPLAAVPEGRQHWLSTILVTYSFAESWMITTPVTEIEQPPIPVE